MAPTEAKFFFSIRSRQGFTHYFFKDKANVYYEGSNEARPFYCRRLYKIGSLVNKANPWSIASSFYERSLKALITGPIDASYQGFSITSSQYQEPKTQIISKHEPYRPKLDTNTYH